MTTLQAAVRAAAITPHVPVAYHPLQSVVPLITRAASEGVPMRAIARIFNLSYEHVLNALNRAVGVGQIVALPKSDWTMPTVTPAHRVSTAELEFMCRQTFRLTNLEAGFLAVLLRCLFVEKDKLHAVVERQRQSRPLRPVAPEVTDPKMVDVMICKLRKKMRANNSKFVISTSWGRGYYLDTPTKKAILARVLPVSRET